jgi:hypothetical protein
MASPDGLAQLPEAVVSFHFAPQAREGLQQAVRAFASR